MNKPFAITLDVGSSLANKTGSWRTERPVYRDLLPPCNNACPAGENIQAWLYEAEEGGERHAHDHHQRRRRHADARLQPTRVVEDGAVVRGRAARIV